jgi:hypothetical protein
MNKVHKVIAITAIIQCAATPLFSVAVEARDEVRHQRPEFKEASLLERDQRRFARDEVLLRKSVRRYADNGQIGALQDRVRRDLLDVVDDRGQPDNGNLDASSTLAKRHGRHHVS